LYKKEKAFFLGSAGPFAGKCAYCEQIISANQFGDVEHYRPKLAVQDENWVTVKILQNGIEVAHPGYYWLAYNWENLLPACELCNSPNEGRKFGKGNRFPVEGQYALAPGDEARELPKLLNPRIDDPANHLSIDESGILSWSTPRGKATIEILGLNERDLPRLRLQKMKEVRRLMNQIFARMGDQDEHTLGAEMRDLEALERDFVMVRRRAVQAAFDEAEKLSTQRARQRQT
jgi:hypothetical protein